MADAKTSGDGLFAQAASGTEVKTTSVVDMALADVLLSAQRDVTLLFTRDGVINYASPSILKIAGYTPDSILNKNFIEFVHPEDVDHIAEHYLRFAEGHDDPPNQFRVRVADGSYLWCEARLGKVDRPGYEGCSVANLREIGQYQRMHENIRASERAIGIGSWRWDLQHDTPEWSDGLYQLLGLDPSRDKVSVEFAYNLWHPEDRERIGELVTEVLKAPANFDTTAQIRHAAGHYLTARLHGFVECNPDGTPTALVGVVHDITRQTRIEEALRENERHYRIVIDEASDLIARYDNVGNCTFMSPSCETILGHPASEFNGHGPLRHVLKEDRRRIVSVYEKALEHNAPLIVTYRAINKAGDIVWLEANIRPLYDDDNELEEIIIVARDITERKATEDSLRAAREKAETANRTKSRFLANMSHELRTPLNAIIGFSDLMCEEMFGELGSDQYRDYTKLIRESGQFLLELINDILDMSKVEAGKYDLFLEEVTFKKLVDATARIVQQRAREKRLKLKCVVDPDLPTFYADERAVKQILLNLLSNAVKFTPEGGKVSLVAIRDGDNVHVTVTDTGVGIPEDALPRLGQPFEQVATDAEMAQAGSGLGLALVKSFVTLHGGTFEIESTLGAGTTVTFALPLRQKQEEPVRKSA